jgi:hypothetical protein
MKAAFSADSFTGTSRSQDDEPLPYFQRLNPEGVDFDVVEVAVSRDKTQSIDLQAIGGRTALMKEVSS